MDLLKPLKNSCFMVIKLLLRKYIYPIYIICNKIINYKYLKHLKIYDYDRVIFNQRGNDIEYRRRNLNKIHNIKGKSIFIFGAGDGKEALSYFNYKPKKIVITDFFNYDKEWVKIIKQGDLLGIKVEAYQCDIADLNSINEKFDVVSSEATLEHLNNFNRCISNLVGILKKGGVFYSTFGPVWYSWGGDHISGRNDLQNGLNHLILDKKKYRNYIESFTNDDQILWTNNNMFSYLETNQYFEVFKNLKLKLKYCSLIIDKRVLNPFRIKKVKTILERKKLNLSNLLVSGITVIYENK